MKKFYESEDVRTLSNNVERKFGLSSIYDGFMFIAPEVKGDLCLEQAEFQSLVSGEDISIACKHKVRNYVAHRRERGSRSETRRRRNRSSGKHLGSWEAMRCQTGRSASYAAHREKVVLRKLTQ